jgi:hypothetical protein
MRPAGLCSADFTAAVRAAGEAWLSRKDASSDRFMFLTLCYYPSLQSGEIRR